MMPQKKNPGPLELLRGRSGRIHGLHMAALTMMKGLPSGYNRDFHEVRKVFQFHAGRVTVRLFAHNLHFLPAGALCVCFVCVVCGLRRVGVAGQGDFGGHFGLDCRRHGDYSPFD